MCASVCITLLTRCVFFVHSLRVCLLLQVAKAAEHMRLALAIYENQLGADHQSTKDVTLSLMQLEGATLS